MKPTYVSWSLYDRIERTYLAAGVTPPTRAALNLFEIADEDAAIKLFDLIEEMAFCKAGVEPAALARARALCIRAILRSVEAHRGRPLNKVRRVLASLKALKKARAQDRQARLENPLKNPELSQDILVRLLIGARMVGAVEEEHDELGWKIRVVALEQRGDWLRSAQDWVFELIKDGELFDRVVECALKGTVKNHPSANLVRRLSSLKKEPTRTKFRKLLADERKADHDGLEVLESALKYAARRAMFPHIELPSDWLARIEADSMSIRLVASGAHQLLVRGLPGQGRSGAPDLDRFAAQVAQAFLDLTGREISYRRPVDAKSGPRCGRTYGDDLDFMTFALQMVDGSATAAQAQNQIDKVRGW